MGNATKTRLDSLQTTSKKLIHKGGEQHVNL